MIMLKVRKSLGTGLQGVEKNLRCPESEIFELQTPYYICLLIQESWNFQDGTYSSTAQSGGPHVFSVFKPPSLVLL